MHPLYFRLIEGVHWIGAGSARDLREGEARVFIEVLWAAATPAGRAAFMKAMQGAEGPMPWSALTAQAEGAPMRAPAAMELILGAADLGEEGVTAYRIDGLTAEGIKAVAALRGWDLPIIAAITSPAAWHLDRIDSPVGTLGVSTTKIGADVGSGDQGGEVKSGDEGTQADNQQAGEPETQQGDAQQGPPAEADKTAPTKPKPWTVPTWGWLAIAGGGTLAAVGIYYAGREKEE